mmetsp:Transcript_64839/g.104963  ORF Transcript_64839/g.104963 Transcript_64839/m.104963 type:complete len:81 (-) Transcript_64839:18-260(-)
MRHVTHINASCQTQNAMSHMCTSCHTHEHVMSHASIFHITRTNESYQTYERAIIPNKPNKSHELLQTLSTVQKKKKGLSF